MIKSCGLLIIFFNKHATCIARIVMRPFKQRTHSSHQRNLFYFTYFIHCLLIRVAYFGVESKPGNTTHNNQRCHRYSSAAAVVHPVFVSDPWVVPPTVPACIVVINRSAANSNKKMRSRHVCFILFSSISIRTLLLF
eukprot:1122242_1